MKQTLVQFAHMLSHGCRFFMVNIISENETFLYRPDTVSCIYYGVIVQLELLSNRCIYLSSINVKCKYNHIKKKKTILFRVLLIVGGN